MTTGYGRIGGGRSAGAIAVAVLLPPLALHLAAARPRQFWIGTGLTVAGLVPGILYALATVLRHRPRG